MPLTRLALMRQGATTAYLLVVAGILVIPPHSLSNSPQAKSDDVLWRSFRVHGEEFTVPMPRSPRMFLNYITSKSFQRTEERIYSAYSKGAVYLVVSYKRSSFKETLENFKQHHCPQAKFTYVKDKPLSGYAGKEYALKFGDTEVVGLLNVYLTNQHGYAVAAIQARDDASLREYFMSGLQLAHAQTDVSSAKPPPTDSSHAIEEDPSVVVGGRSQVSRKPIVVSKPEPSYTEDARKREIIGSVVLRVVFDASGEVTNILVVHSLDKGLTEKAIAAAKHLTFIPAIKDGRFVSYWMELQYNFNLF